MGDVYEFTSPKLPDGLVIVEGGNRSGKTTFADLIFFAFGGSVKQFAKKGKEQHKEIRSDTNNYVRLSIEIDGRPYSLTRRFDAPQDILVSSLERGASQADVQVLPVHRHEGRNIFSDWLLDQLGIVPVTLFSGSHRGKLNFADLMRLIYHDQALDPARVFMKLDRDSFVTDSRDFRRAVFEILVGESSERYYETLGKLRFAERTLMERQGALAAFKGAVSQVSRGERDTNEVFLRRQISEREVQIERLQRARLSLRKTTPAAPSPEADLTVLRRQLAHVEMEQGVLDRQRGDLTAERVRLMALESQLIDEVVRVQKIIHAHETLSLFSPDTCPCCLRRVDRAAGHCICGQDIAEDSYQRFFYSADEYVDILKSRQKNVETVRDAKSACDADMERLTRRSEDLKRSALETRNQMERWAGSEGAYGTKLERLDDELVEVRVALEKLRNQLELELERNKLESSTAAAREEVTRLTAEVQKLELAAQADRSRKVARFDAIYSKLMTETLSDVRTARIDPEDYEPILNESEYREASATVTRRLMYYLTLLQLSLEQPIPFPQFLLIDTPETAGIDRANLSRAIGKIPEVLADHVAQVILTTGPDRYPRELQRYRVLSLRDGAKLLQLKTNETQPDTSNNPSAAPWEYWEFQGEDVTYDILREIEDDLIQAVQDGDYPVGFTELDDLTFRNIDHERGQAEFHVSFSADHGSEEFGFVGHVMGELTFDPHAETKEELVESIKLRRVEAVFDMD